MAHISPGLCCRRVLWWLRHHDRCALAYMAAELTTSLYMLWPVVQPIEHDMLEGCNALFAGLVWHCVSVQRAVRMGCGVACASVQAVDAPLASMCSLKVPCDHQSCADARTQARPSLNFICITQPGIGLTSAYVLVQSRFRKGSCQKCWKPQ